MSDDDTYADGHADGWSEGYAEGLSETEELRAQLAAAQAQLAVAEGDVDLQQARAIKASHEALNAEARLEAVRALCVIPDWPPQGVDINGRALPRFVSMDAVLAALSAAPQPEPAASDDESPRCICGHSAMRHGPEMDCIECRCPLDGVQ